MPSLRRGSARPHGPGPSPGQGRGRTRTNLGPGYHKLWSAAAISTLGDGVFLTALPLLAATLSRDPRPVSLVASAGWLPWLLFGLVSGALVDRWDRRQVMWCVDAVRFVIVGALGVAVLAGWATIPLLVAVGFVLGAGQTLFDSAAQSLIPALISRDTKRLERANSQLYGAQTVGQGLAGPPVGGALFALAAWIPFPADAVSFLASSALITTIRGDFAPKPAAGANPNDDGAPRTSLRADIAEGLRWLFAHRLLRTLAVMVGLLSLAFMAGEAILVLFAQEELGLGSVGYGLLLTGSGVGGVAGSLAATRLSRHASTATLLVASTLAEAAATLVFGATTSPWIAGAMLPIIGAAVMVFNVVGVSLRQAIVPDHLTGRVVSAFRMLAYSAMPLGAVLGGVVGRALGLRAPFLLGAAVLAVTGVLVLPVVNDRTIQAARVAAQAASSTHDT